MCMYVYIYIHIYKYIYTYTCHAKIFQAPNVESGPFPFPFGPTGLSLFPCGIEWNKMKSSDIK